MKIYVYGTGCGAGDLVDEALPIEKIEAFVERDGGGSFLGRPVISLEELAGRDFDLLIAASRDAERMAKELDALGVSADKVFYLKNHLVPVDRNRSYELASEILRKDYVNRIRFSERLIRVPLWTEQEKITGPGSDNDYVRLKTLEAICMRLDCIPGAAAELGVYRGGFARWINQLLPARRLYLFDTFSGFDETESAACGTGFTQAHRNTAVDRVVEIMPHPEQIVIRRGLFPRTSEGLEGERFALVSLDVDLEESTLAGLRFFLPRMQTGGYLLLHDYNNPKFPGVKRAVERYEAEVGLLRAVPLCDVNGTLVVSA